MSSEVRVLPPFGIEFLYGADTPPVPFMARIVRQVLVVTEEGLRVTHLPLVEVPMFGTRAFFGGGVIVSGDPYERSTTYGVVGA